jgi:hypothetical protein
MGLDQYAYVAAKAGQQNEYYEAEGEYVDGEWKPHKPTVAKPREIAYWRKHPHLQGWMEKLWENKLHSKGESPWGISFNGIELELTWEDLDQLEQDVRTGNLPATSGFFFGEDADDYYQEEDLKFIRNAKAELILGLRVFYNSSW